MEKPSIVLDTNIIISALMSRRGAAFRLISLAADEHFDFHLSVPLVLEYEEVAKRMLGANLPYTEQEIDDFIDYLCAIGKHHLIYYLWRPTLSDPSDEMVLELAVVAQSPVIVTYNLNDFSVSQRFGIQAMTPKQFLQRIGELP
ncbi:MAG: putative toxin-antitoxin system toxin component, PIN family [Anaerolineae bacterium]|nr:putative toxin-antitoxin system toxin component, PIN family [Anaerolineae bacterium]